MGKTVLSRVCDILQRQYGVPIQEGSSIAYFFARGIELWQVVLEETNHDFRIEVFKPGQSAERDELRRRYFDERDRYKRFEEIIPPLQEGWNWDRTSFVTDTCSSQDLAEKVLVILAKKALKFSHSEGEAQDEVERKNAP